MSRVQGADEKQSTNGVEEPDRETTQATDSSGAVPSTRWRQILYPSALIASMIVLWQAYARLADVPTYILPAPTDIVGRVARSWSLLQEHALVTLAEIGVGFVIGVAFGAVLAIVMAYSRVAENMLYPPIIGSQAVPKIAIAPLLVLWLGFGMTPKVAVVAMMVFFPITITMVEGLRSVDENLLNLLRSVNANPVETFFRIRLPNALPYIFSGLKIGITQAVIGAVVAEWVGADAGLGYLLIYANTRLDATLLFASLTILVVIGIALFLLVGLAERLALPWHRASGRAAG